MKDPIEGIIGAMFTTIEISAVIGFKILCFLVPIFLVGVWHVSVWLYKGIRRLFNWAFSPRLMGVKIGPLTLTNEDRVRHCHIVGSSGSGKTEAAKLLILQDIAQGNGCFIIDPKGDRELFEEIRGFCKTVGRSDDLKLLSATYPGESCMWNPCGLGNTSELQSKFYNSNVYSEAFYAKACETGLIRAFNKLTKDKPHGFGLNELTATLKQISETEKSKTMEGLFYDFESIAQSEWAPILGCGSDLGHEQEIIDRWEERQETFPSRAYAITTVRDHAAMLRNWTTPWLKRVASEINRADARDVDRNMEAHEKPSAYRKKLKHTINVVYKWGIEERLIAGVLQSPVYGMEIKTDREEKRPEILTVDEIRILLKRAGEQEHPWYPVWVAAMLTGCRSGELNQLRRSDLEVVSHAQALEEDKKSFDKRRYGFIRVRRSWCARLKKVGPTKAGYWRNVPVASGFYWFLVNQLKVENKKPDDFLFPRFREWDKGEQARVLRMFCIANGIRSIKFHTLRACFATQIISTGVPATTVMKICGWRDLKTMQRYIRLAGIDEGGATEGLNFIPTETAVMEAEVSRFFASRTFDANL